MKESGFWQRKVVDPLLAFLKQGLSPEKLALTVAFGVVLGVLPVLGSTTLLCTLAAFALRLNLSAIQLVNYLVYALQLILLIPFFKAGEWLFQARPLPISLTEIQMMLSKSIWQTIHILWETTWHAIIVWLLMAPIAIALIYFIMLPIFRKMSMRVSVNGS